MRRLYPPRKGDQLEAEGRYRRADGSLEQWSRHRDASGRVTLRVEAMPSAGLWHLVIAPDGRPERVEARLPHPEGVMEVAMTCFEDEVLIWRRGAEPASEGLDMPPGYRLFWPPVAGRAECLAGLEDLFDEAGRAAVMFLSLTSRPPSRGGLRARPVKLGLLRRGASIGIDGETTEASGGSSVKRLLLQSPGLPKMQAVFDEAGDIHQWLEDDALIAELVESIHTPTQLAVDSEGADSEEDVEGADD